jgi:hypothetical protein
MPELLEVRSDPLTGVAAVQPSSCQSKLESTPS